MEKSMLISEQNDQRVPAGRHCLWEQVERLALRILWDPAGPFATLTFTFPSLTEALCSEEGTEWNGKEELRR